MGTLLTLFKARFHLLTNSPPTYYPPIYPPPNHYISVPLLILTTKRHPHVSCMHRISIRNSHQDYFEIIPVETESDCFPFEVTENLCSFLFEIQNSKPPFEMCEIQESPCGRGAPND